MERVDYTALYAENEDFKRYVDRYCTKHRVSVDEAIQHAKEVASQNRSNGCIECAEQHDQLAEWLEELKQYRS